MDKDILITVIIPCYNVSQYVEKAIGSILSQSYRNLEVWIIDDASTDDTLEKIKSFKDERIRIAAFTENTQKVGAVNDVLEKAKGDYIAFQDADDWSERERLALQLKAFSSDEELGICFTNYRYVGDKNHPAQKIALSNQELRNEFLNYTYKRSAGTSPTCCPSMMISRTALESTHGYSPYFTGRVAEDIQWIYRIMKMYKACTVNEILYNYSVREGSFTNLQAKGIKPKYAYSWQLLSKIIYKDIHEGIDLLLPENKNLLQKTELEACEQALAEQVHETRRLESVYKESTRYKLGKLLLSPLEKIKRIVSGKR